jgi:hypothetical protein
MNGGRSGDYRSGLSNMEHCCQNMDAYATEKNSLVDYDSYTRSYTFFVDSPNGTHQAIWFCPWCGAKLPELLADTWVAILKKEYDIDDPFRE